MLASLFAWRTPPWQAPDEPAHYAYVATVARTGRPPTLVAACYNERYKNALVAGNFATRWTWGAFATRGTSRPFSTFSPRHCSG